MEPLLLDKRQALQLAHYLADAVRDNVLDQDIFSRGPQAVLAAIQADLSRLLGQDRQAEPGDASLRRQLPPEQS